MVVDITEVHCRLATRGNMREAIVGVTNHIHWRLKDRAYYDIAVDFFDTTQQSEECLVQTIRVVRIV